MQPFRVGFSVQLVRSHMGWGQETCLMEPWLSRGMVAPCLDTVTVASFRSPTASLLDITWVHEGSWIFLEVKPYDMGVVCPSLNMLGQAIIEAVSFFPLKTCPYLFPVSVLFVEWETLQSQWFSQNLLSTRFITGSKGIICQLWTCTNFQ